MNRSLTFFVGPETVLALLSVAVFALCAWHNSGAGRDVLILEKVVMLLPFIVVPLVFATVFVPGAKNWWWLGRAIGFTFLMLMVCGCRLIAGFGTGAKGQDAAFILIMTFGLIGVSIATSICGAMILAETKPAFAEWFRGRKFIGSTLTLISAAPIGFLLGISATMIFGVVMGTWSAFKR